MKATENLNNTPAELILLIENDDLTQFEAKLNKFIKDNSPNNSIDANKFCNELLNRLSEMQSKERVQFFEYMGKKKPENIETIRTQVLLVQKASEYFAKRNNLIKDILDKYITKWKQN